MAGLTNNIASALATAAAAITHVENTSPTPVDAVPATPFVWIGPPKIAQITPGSWDTRIYAFTMNYIIQRVREDADQLQLNDAIEDVLTAFRTGITLGLINPQPIAEIRAVDSDKFWSLGGTDYQGIEFTVVVEVYGPQSYTA